MYKHKLCTYLLQYRVSFARDEIGVLALRFSFLELCIVGEIIIMVKIYVYGQSTDDVV